jgi:hypothetical protein
MNAWFRWAGLLLAGWCWLWIADGCGRPVNPVEEGELAFSSDTLAFDSIFVNFLTPSERLIVHNRTGRSVQISRIWLEQGADTEFSMVVDGRERLDIEDLILANGDSMLILVNLRSTLRDQYAEEFLNFQVGDQVQQVLIRARILDAYLLRARLQQDGDRLFLAPGSFFFGQDTVLMPGKPIVIDGPVLIPEGVRVTVMPGTELFFTAYKFPLRDSVSRPYYALFSGLLVNGTLHAEGTPNAPIVFQGSRFDSLYQENPAQWRGLNFQRDSRDNVLHFCQVKNALIGLQVDSLSNTAQPKVSIRYSEIRNMGAYGIWGRGFAASAGSADAPMVLMENSIVNTCKDRTLYIEAGGVYEFYNCTFANFSLARFSRRIPQMAVGNWFSFDGVTGVVYPCFARMSNCIVWGSEEDEVVLDTLNGGPLSEFVMRRCILRLTPENEPAILPHLLESLKNEDPRFNDYFTRDYRLKDNSPAIDVGLDFSARYRDDFRGRSDSLRYNGFDLGALEYWPIIE